MGHQQAQRQSAMMQHSLNELARQVGAQRKQGKVSFTRLDERGKELEVMLREVQRSVEKQAKASETDLIQLKEALEQLGGQVSVQGQQASMNAQGKSISLSATQLNYRLCKMEEDISKGNKNL